MPWINLNAREIRAMDISSGDHIILQFSTFEDRFLGIVVDIKKAGRLLVFATLSEQVRKRVRMDGRAVVKYAYDGRLLGFSTRVLNTLPTKDTLIELAGPERVFEAEDRKEPRCACCYPAIIVEGERAARGVVEDMSASCARVRFLGNDLVPFPEEIGCPVRLTFHPFEMDENGYSVECSVVKAFMKNGERYTVLRFDESEKDVRRRIASFIEAQVCCSLPAM